jgi:sulfate adenylyltransferase
MKTEKKEAVPENIPAHGGTLVWLVQEGPAAEEMMGRVPSLPQVQLSPQEAYDLEMIATGAYSPLSGFMGSKDYESVLRHKRLTSGLPWTIPITLAVSVDQAARLKEGKEILLASRSTGPLGSLFLEERFSLDKKREAKNVFGTEDLKHPGVANLFSRGEVLLGGSIRVFQRQPSDFYAYHMDPKDTRARFAEKGWRRVVGFQTRNPIHRAHEYIIKSAMEIVDGLFLNPLVGETKKDDIPAGVRMKSYEALLKKYFPSDRVVLAVLPVSMRYAGPREAIFHALVRKNFGCTHFIVGRDHAGVGGYYGPFDAHRIFEEFDPSEIGIQPLFFDNAFYCYRCQSMATAKTCPHGEEVRLILTGTRVREMLQSGEKPPPEFSRPEVIEILAES